MATAAIGTVLAAYSANLKAPAVGYIFDQGHIRTVAGVPGAARIVDGPVVEADLEKVTFAPVGNRAIAVSSAPASLVLITELNSTPVLRELSGLPSTFELAAFSPDGLSVAVYNLSCECTQVVNGLGGPAEVRRTVETREPPRALALDDRGNVAIAYESGINMNLESGIFRTLPVPAVTALSFAPDGSLAAAARELKSVALIRDPAGAGEISASLAEGVGLGRPIGLMFDRGNRLLTVDEAGTLFVLDPVSNELTSFPCECRPSMAEPMASGGRYLLGKVEPGPLWVLTPGPHTRVFFVPRTTGASE
jgi:hypothetical protein